MAANAIASFISLILLLLHLGCLPFFSSSRNHRSRNRRCDSFLLCFNDKTSSQKTGFVSFLKRCFSCKTAPPELPPSHPAQSVPAVRYSSVKDSDLPDSLRDIHPCSVCGEIFQSSSLLEHHNATSHAISDLDDGENIVRMIFGSGWPNGATRPPTINRIMKINNFPKIITRFEEHRESVKSRVSEKAKKTVRDERCAADGNELLRFCCTTFVCELDSNICSQQYCSLCGIIRSGFSPKMDGISTLPTSYAAHVTLADDIEEEFRFMRVKRAMLVCRVIAGRIGCESDLVDKGDPGFDSSTGRCIGDEDDELLVFNPRAVLPCFIILYGV